MPLFPKLGTLLTDAFGAADDGAEFVIRRTRDTCTNLWTHFARIVERAGLNPWPKLFQNLRATRATELSDRFPGHVAAAWLGHSVKVAKGHYWQVKDDHFDAATSAASMLQPVSETDHKTPKRSQETPLTTELRGMLRVVPPCTVGDTGLEPVTSTV